MDTHTNYSFIVTATQKAGRPAHFGTRQESECVPKCVDSTSMDVEVQGCQSALNTCGIRQRKVKTFRKQGGDTILFLHQNRYGQVLPIVCKQTWKLDRMDTDSGRFTSRQKRDLTPCIY